MAGAAAKRLMGSNLQEAGATWATQARLASGQLGASCKGAKGSIQGKYSMTCKWWHDAGYLGVSCKGARGNRRGGHGMTCKRQA